MSDKEEEEELKPTKEEIYNKSKETEKEKLDNEKKKI